MHTYNSCKPRSICAPLSLNKILIEALHICLTYPYLIFSFESVPFRAFLTPKSPLSHLNAPYRCTSTTFAPLKQISCAQLDRQANCRRNRSPARLCRCLWLVEALRRAQRRAHPKPWKIGGLWPKTAVHGTESVLMVEYKVV
jgi:hypothetical protein